tara:strand:- start:230 stop:391 length:162 start_codon:yes stop_codon:yes gene_type:complete
MNIEKMRDILADDEIENIHSLSSRNLFYYVRDTIISKYSDDEIRGLFEAIQDE